MFATGKDKHLIFTQKLFSGDYLFVYDSDDNNVVVLIHPTSESEDTPEAEMPDQEVADTMGDDIMQEMELKKGKKCDDYDSICGQEHEIYDDT